MLGRGGNVAPTQWVRYLSMRKCKICKEYFEDTMVSFVSDFYSVCYNTYCMKQVAPWKFKKADEE